MISKMKNTIEWLEERAVITQKVEQEDKKDDRCKKTGKKTKGLAEDVQ